MIILLIILLIIIIYLGITLGKSKRELDNAVNALNNRAYAIAQDSYKKAKAALDAQLVQDREKINNELAQAKRNADLAREAYSTGATDYKEKMALQQQKAFAVFHAGLEAFNERAQIERDEHDNAIYEMNQEWLDIYHKLEDAKKKRDAINQEIMRQRELEEKEDFYKIQLSTDDISDIQILNEVRARLHKNTALDKLIYDLYIAKPVNEMIKRVLNGGAPSGIYKITRLKTGEVYIGKSTNIHDRWQQHAKSCFHCGTISHSILHSTMERDGINNFTWELLEEVPKDKLTEREKYWISFYDSTKFGLNERLG